MAIDKSTWNKKIKVSQSTIDTIKKQGMSASLKSASSSNSPEYREALRRMYGDKRVSAATGATPKKMTGQPSGYRNPKQAGPMTGQPSGYRNPKQTGPKSTAKKASTSYSPAPMSSTAKALVKKNAAAKAPKKDNTKSNLLKGVAGTVAAVGLFAAGRGKGAALISKLSPQVGRALNSTPGRVLSGTYEKAKVNASATSGRIAATHKKEVSQSQYDAMISAARLKGTKLVKSTTPKSAPKKATATKKTGLSAGRRFDANAPK
jgi:hypothetical protein